MYFRTCPGHATGRPHADTELAPGSHTGDSMDPLQQYFWTDYKDLDFLKNFTTINFVTFRGSVDSPQ